MGKKQNDYVLEANQLVCVEKKNNNDFEYHLMIVLDYNENFALVKDIDANILATHEISWQKIYLCTPLPSYYRLRKTIPKTIDGLSLYFLTDTREFSTCYYPGKFIGRRTDEYNQVLNCFVYADGSRQDLAAEVTLFGYKVPSVIEIRKALNQYNEFDPIILKAFDIKQQNLIKQQQENKNLI